MTFRGLGCSLFLFALSSEPVRAQADVAEPIHWAYGAYFGTGVYRMGGGEEIYVLSARPRWQIREATLVEDGKRSTGVELRFPITVGAHQFDTSAIGETLGIDNVGTVSAVPGVEIDP
jgi:hypothetical protein